MMDLSPMSKCPPSPPITDRPTPNRQQAGSRPPSGIESVTNEPRPLLATKKPTQSMYAHAQNTHPPTYTYTGVSPPAGEGPAPFLQGDRRAASPTNGEAAGGGAGEEDLHHIATMIEHLRCVPCRPPALEQCEQVNK
jgi:hypothetical protein